VYLTEEELKELQRLPQTSAGHAPAYIPSPRDKEVMRLFYKKITKKALAKWLGISVTTLRKAYLELCEEDQINPETGLPLDEDESE
jgi:transcription initiation factor TFIIIB Brf1 subunit/transcription initiation factor TFIIB